MSFGSFDANRSSGTMAEINMVPLIDVMLVLLVVFMITAPLLSHSIRINVPQVSAEQLEQTPVAIDLAIDDNGLIYWNEDLIDIEELGAQFRQQAQLEPQPEVRIRADLATRYGLLAEVMGAARQAGMKRLGFVTTPAASSKP